MQECASVILTAEVTCNVHGQVREENKSSLKENKLLILSFAGALRGHNVFLQNILFVSE